MKYIETLREGDRVGEVYLCKKKQNALTKAGKPYDNVTLQDKTGTLSAKIWDVNSAGIEDFDSLDYVYVVGDVTMFQGAPQLNIKRIRKVGEGEYDPSDYLPVSSKDIGQMYQELMKFVKNLQNPHLKALAELFFENESFAARFQNHSAAKSVHHGFVGGLLEHTLSVTQNCDFISMQYPFLNRDLLLTAAMLHDIGKLDELSTFPENDYTDAGQLLGHITIGAMQIRNQISRIPDFPVRLANELLHCILSHHGELEYGSPKKPALAEAIALSMADNLDAKMESFKEAIASIPENNLEWQGFNHLFDSNIRRTGRNEI
ncbi:MAG: HD domain-containing protein [Lachnospiraceae bacterium]|nr:HD domain-containing protein [Lachnospiraceae bacterium]